MSVPADIHTMVDRLRRADIPMDNLAYELGDHEWQELREYMEGFAQHRDADWSYINDMVFLGLHVRKRERC